LSSRASSPSISRRRIRLDGALDDRPLSLALFLEAPLIFLAFYVWLVGVRGHWRMQDFMAVRGAAGQLLHGRSPYPDADPATLLAAKHLVYPPLVGYLFAPFAALPYAVAAPLWFFLVPALLAGSLALLGVRDPRCYGVVFLWYPTVACLGTGALGPLLVLLVACAWRWRHRPGVVAPTLALAVVAKLFLWPLVVWLLATRRFRAAALTCATALVVLIVPFAPLGSHAALHEYPQLLRSLDGIFGPASFSGTTFFRALGITGHGAVVIVLLVTAALVLWAFVLGRRGGDATALTVALLAALLASPIVWMHYYVLLVVPIALARPRLSGLWLLPLLYWASPELESFGELRRLAVGIGVTTAVALVSVRRDVVAADR